MGESLSKRAFNYQHVPQSSATNDGLVDSISHLLFTDNFNRPYSHEHLLSGKSSASTDAALTVSFYMSW